MQLGIGDGESSSSQASPHMKISVPVETHHSHWTGSTMSVKRRFYYRLGVNRQRGRSSSPQYTGSSCVCSVI